jgi:hypothetical protein
MAALGAGLALKDFIDQTVTGNANLGRMSANLQSNAQELSNWDGAIQAVGGHAGEAAVSFGALTGAFEQIQLTGTSPLIPYFNLLGISLSDLKSPAETLLKLADRFHNMPAPQAFALGTGMGLSPATINLLEQGREAVARQLAEQERANKVTGDNVRVAQDAQRRMILFQQSLKGVENELAIGVLPALTSFLDWMRKIAQTDLGPWSKQLGGITSDVGELDKSAGRLSDTLSAKLGPAFGAAFGGALNIIDGILRELDHLAKATDAALHGRWGEAASEAGRAIAESPAGKLVRYGIKAVTGSDPYKEAAPTGAAAGAGASAGSGRGNGSIADRNNNPGNLTDGQGHFRRFATREEGLAAMRRQIQLDFNRHGQKTVRALINDPSHGWSNQWAPGNSAASSANYIAAVARALGVGADTPIDMNDPATLAKLTAAMSAVERGGPGISGGAAAAASVASAARQGASGSITPASASTTNTHQTTVGTIIVNTKATDAAAIAKDIRPAVERYAFVPQSNTGLTS